MERIQFVEKLNEILEIEDNSFSEESNLRDAEEYDSVSIMAIIAFIDKVFDQRLSSAQFEKITTVKSLMEAIGEDNFE